MCIAAKLAADMYNRNTFPSNVFQSSIIWILENIFIVGYWIGSLIWSFNNHFWSNSEY